MTLTHAHTNGAAVASSLPRLAEHVRAIDPDLQQRLEGYLSEILGSLGMDLTSRVPPRRPRASCRRSSTPPTATREIRSW